MKETEELLEEAIRQISMEIDQLPFYTQERIKKLVKELAVEMHTRGRKDEKYFNGNWISPGYE